MRLDDTDSARSARAHGSAGFTLAEVVVVLVILATIAAFVTTSVGRIADEARDDTTRISLGTLRDAMVGPYRNDLGPLPDKVADLQRKPDGEPIFDPRTRRGWRGPYVRPSGATYVLGWVTDPPKEGEVHVSFSTSYGVAGDPAAHDGYGSPIVLQIPDLDANGVASAEEARLARLVSAGLDRVIDTPRDEPFPTITQCDDDLVLYLESADLRAP